jgi:hypothetical protein
MRLEAKLIVTGFVCQVELEFTSCSKEGVHYFKMLKPIKQTNQRFKWEPHKGHDRLQALAEAIDWIARNNKMKWWKKNVCT